MGLLLATLSLLIPRTWALVVEESGTEKIDTTVKVAKHALNAQ